MPTRARRPPCNPRKRHDPDARRAPRLPYSSAGLNALSPDGGGWRALERGCGSARGAGTSCLHVAVDDGSRVTYAELLPGERKGTCAAFVGRCLGFFEDLGVAVERVMTDNGPGYRSRLFNEALEAHMDHYNWDRPHGACGACRRCRA